MSEHSDPVDEVMRHARYVLTAAARVGQTLLNVRQQQQDRAARESQERSRQLAQQIAQAEQQARVRYRFVESPEWWEQARPEQVGQIYRDSVAFAQQDPAAQQARQRIETEAAARYGVDLREHHPNEAGAKLAQAREEHARKPQYSDTQAAADLAAAEAADQAEQLRAQAGDLLDQVEENQDLATGANLDDLDHDVQADEAPRQSDQVDQEQKAGADQALSEDRAGAAGVDQAAAEELVDHANSAGSTKDGDERVPWDSPERRAATEEQLHAAGVPADAVQARMMADVSQAKPAREGAKVNQRSSSKARPSRGQSAGREQERGMSR